MPQRIITVTWQATASLSDPVWIGTEGPMILRLPTGFQGNAVGFVHYLRAESLTENAPVLGSAMDMDEDGADLVRAVRANKAHLMLETLAGAGWIALRALQNGVAQPQSEARSGLLIAREGG